MPTAGDQIPGGTTAIARRLADLERQVKELRAARRLETASVGAGGLRIVEGGRFAMDTPAGVRMIDVGKIDDGRFNHADGRPQQAQFMRREDGSLMFGCFAYPPSGETQAWTFYDRTGNVILAEDTASGQGLARPALPLPMWPSYACGWDYWPRNSGTTMQELWTGLIYKQQPKVVVVVNAAMDTSGATGLLELKINGVVQGSPQTVVFSVDPFTFGPFTIPGDHMSQVDIVLQGRRSTGTGTIRASIHSAYTTGT
jgi:hypothetical protein